MTEALKATGWKEANAQHAGQPPWCRRLVPLTLALLMLVHGAVAANIRVVGPGTQSCGNWMDARRGRNYDDMLGWILGFLTGVAYIGNEQSGYDPLRGLGSNPGGAVATWLDDYCRDHPHDQLLEGAKAFVDAHPHD
jgi:hypothetical protein